jgi:hypothetical protein
MDDTFDIRVDTTLRTEYVNERLLFRKSFDSANSNKKVCVSRRLIDLIKNVEYKFISFFFYLKDVNLTV